MEETSDIEFELEDDDEEENFEEELFLEDW